MSELHYLSFVDAARMIRDKSLSPVEYTEALLARAQRLQPEFSAFLQLDGDRAMDEARQREQQAARGEITGPLHGVAFALKDIIDAKDLRTTAHSKILAENVADEDAEVTRRYRSNGAILLGKLSTHEFALGGPAFDLPWPPARNPWDRRMFPGGSSSGSGAAVAAGIVPSALGTDTGGSVRNPASMCGLYGMKASYGRVSRHGVVPLSFTLDHVGPLTRTARENAVILNVIAGHDRKDPGSAPVPAADFTRLMGQSIEGMRVGVIRHFYRADLVADPVVDRGIEAALAVLETLGAKVIDVATEALGVFADCNRTILLSEAYAIHEQWLQEQPENYSAMTRERLLPGAFFRAVDYVQALRMREQIQAGFHALFDDVDLIVTASSMEPPFPMDDPQAVAEFYPRQARAPFNLTGSPALSIPCGFTDDGLPLSFQLIGKPFDEARMYQLADAYERATDWTNRHPDID
jgi:aspartyl-tRNA(Asn)/glutamyl-tRNA(Gln) amidotransferase subunit A